MLIDLIQASLGVTYLVLIHVFSQSSRLLYEIVMMVVPILHTKKLSFRRVKDSPKIIQQGNANAKMKNQTCLIPKPLS